MMDVKWLATCSSHNECYRNSAYHRRNVESQISLETYCRVPFLIEKVTAGEAGSAEEPASRWNSPAPSRH